MEYKGPSPSISPQPPPIVLRMLSNEICPYASGTDVPPVPCAEQVFKFENQLNDLAKVLFWLQKLCDRNFFRDVSSVDFNIHSQKSGP